MSKIRPVLDRVSRPGRYAGNELHAIRKEWDKTQVRFVLGFPDAYEIGMSNLGLAILYHVLNGFDWIAAERVYAPWIDMEKEMRENGIPLLSLESQNPVSRFDVFGISLSYELQYTNVLNMIDLAGIPMRSADRGEADPLVIAGGPCAFNPEPLADFLDAVVLGDGEEAVVDIARLVLESKKKQRKRADTLSALAGLEGVYVPSLYNEEHDGCGRFKAIAPAREGVPASVRARILDTLKPENYPSHPLVPLIEITHDRLSLEIMRGCTRGCRFCAAGILYRPVRQRPVDDLVRQATQNVTNTGYDEVALISLSTSDYGDLPALLEGLSAALADKGITISFPSLRPDTFTPQMAEYARGLKRSGLTLAPEAGTQRLRDIINKSVQEEDLLSAVDTAFEKGWHLVKLYFMIGLPFETLDDVQGIVDLVRKTVQKGRAYGKREIHVSISPFSPKAHTPFQWEAQDTPLVLEQKIELLRRGLSMKNVVLRWRDPAVSRLEAVLGRGDRVLSRVIELAWKGGCRFDAWSEEFRFDVWAKAFQVSGLSMDEYTMARQPEKPLPWDHLSKGVDRDFLLEEKSRALSGEASPDCRTGECRNCGLSGHPSCRHPFRKRKAAGSASKVRSDKDGSTPLRKKPGVRVVRRIRVAYAKETEARYTSHLDTVRIFVRAFRRANIRVALTEGFHAHPRIATGPPLSLGYTSRAEYMDLDIEGTVPVNFTDRLNRRLPAGYRILEWNFIHGPMASLNGSINRVSYAIRGSGISERTGLEKMIRGFLERNAVRVVRERTGQKKEIDIRPSVESIAAKNGGLDLVLRLSPQGSARVEEVLETLFPADDPLVGPLEVERTGMFIEHFDRRLTPLDVTTERKS